MGKSGLVGKYLLLPLCLNEVVLRRELGLLLQREVMGGGQIGMDFEALHPKILFIRREMMSNNLHFLTNTSEDSNTVTQRLYIDKHSPK